MKEEKTKKILFVCTGNTCRSPMAEAIARSILKRWGIKNVAVSSAGLSVAKGDGLNPNSATMLARNGLKLEGFTSTPLTDGLLDEAYAVVCMTENQRKAIEEKRAFDFFSSGGSKGGMHENLHSFYSLVGCEIPDPFGRDLECYRIVFEKLCSVMPTVLKKLGFEEKAVETVAENKTETVEKNTEKPAPKKRGRPRKNPEKPKTDGTPKKRGRPRKTATPSETEKKTENKKDK